VADIPGYAKVAEFYITVWKLACEDEILRLETKNKIAVSSACLISRNFIIMPVTLNIRRKEGEKCGI
jgi:hypothetical protein